MRNFSVAEESNSQPIEPKFDTLKAVAVSTIHYHNTSKPIIFRGTPGTTLSNSSATLCYLGALGVFQLKKNY